MGHFDWARLAENWDVKYVPEIVSRALPVLGDIMSDTNHRCWFTFSAGPWKGDVATSVDRLLPDEAHATDVEVVDDWRATLTEKLPTAFLAGVGAHPEYWAEGAPPRRLAEGMSAWLIALLGWLWPDHAPAFRVRVDYPRWYESFDLVVRTGGEVSLLELAFSD